MSYKLNITASEFDKLHKAMKEFEGDVEKTINDVLHNEAGQLIQDSIRNLIPESHRDWKGKKAAAKEGNSLMSVNENLAITVKTTKAYQYLYFPNDGSNTRKHAGNQQFFEKGGEAVKSEIIERCITKLTNKF